MYRYLYPAMMITLLLSGCIPTAAAVERAPAVAELPQPQLTVEQAPTSVPTLLSTATPSPTPAPTLHPMQIDALRAGSYPGSDILLEEELEPGANYKRYYASYLSEGLKIYALLSVPNGEMPAGGFPAIVFNHGYIPPVEYRTTERYVAYVDRLARSGYIVFRIDYRGHDRSEGSASGAYSSPGYTVDVLNAVSSLQRFPQANPDKIGMWGHSMGGFLTLRAMVVSDAVKAGVIWSGVVAPYADMLYNWRHNDLPFTVARPGGWRSGWVQQFGAPEENPDFWNSVSANAYLADLSGPVQLHHGTADSEVPTAFSQTLYNQIDAVGGEVEYYIYEGDNHNLSNQFNTAMQRTIDFYDRYLK
jgi:dipeptidyl aminopeptidase/acylaminoacyl peptidase